MSNTKFVNVTDQGNLSGSRYSESDIRDLISDIGDLKSKFAAYKTETDKQIAYLSAQAERSVTYGSAIKIQNGYQGFGDNKYINAYGDYIARAGTVGDGGGRYGEYMFKIVKWE
jgi:hypothetical protein